MERLGHKPILPQPPNLSGALSLGHPLCSLEVPPLLPPSCLPLWTRLPGLTLVWEGNNLPS